MTETKTLVAPANTDLGHADEVIQSIYKQVFGNRHLMELDVNKSLEALFMNGDLTVQGFVTALAQSETYRKLFLSQTVLTALLSSTSNTCLDEHRMIKQN
jgi:phycoerythrin-associated linker protein